MSYPSHVEINGFEYKLNTGYEYALACFSCINDPDISDIERTFGVIEILYADKPPDECIEQSLNLAIKFLRCGKETDDRRIKPDMDFEQDESYIKASFLSDYQIDLDETEMHWWKFNVLLQGLSDNCILNRVRDIRNYDLSEIKDTKQRQKIYKLKAQVALIEKEILTEEEQRIVDDFWGQLD